MTQISKMDSFGKNTFGWVRAEVLGALVNAVFLLALCFTIFVDSLLRLIETEPTENPDLLVIVGSVSLGINLLGMLIFYDRTATCRHQGIRRSSVPERRPLKASATEAVALLMPPAETEEPNEFSVHSLTNMADSVHVGGDHTQESTELVVIRPKADPTQPAVRHLSGMASASSSSRNDRVLANEQDTTCIENNSRISSGPRSSSQLNMRGIFLHLMGHAVEAASVVVGSMLVWLVPDSMGEDHINWKPYVDPALSLILVVFIVSTTIPLLKESAMILLQTLPTKLSIHDIKQAVSKMDGVLDVHELHVWQLTGRHHVATLHLTIAKLDDFLHLSPRVKNYFSESGIDNVTIQPEFSELHVKRRGRSCALECGPEMPCHADTCCSRKQPRPEEEPSAS